MLGPPKNAQEKVKQELYYKKKIYEAFNIVSKDKGYIDRKEVSYVMRYLHQFPSEAQVRDYILDQLEEDEPSDYIKYAKFEPFMLKVLMENEFEPNPSEQLLAAFRALDPEGRGYIDVVVMQNLLGQLGIPLREREMESFLKYATDPSGKKVLYEDYVNKLTKENETA